MWYDKKYKTLIALMKPKRLDEPMIIFITNKYLKKQPLRRGLYSLFGRMEGIGNTIDGSDEINPLLIRHKATKSWIYCLSCMQMSGKQGRLSYSKSEKQEHWIQFKLDHIHKRVLQSKLIKLPKDMESKQWLCYDNSRDCVFGIKRQNIAQILTNSYDNELKICCVPSITQLINKAHKEKSKQGKISRRSPNKSMSKHEYYKQAQKDSELREEEFKWHYRGQGANSHQQARDVIVRHVHPRGRALTKTGRQHASSHKKNHKKGQKKDHKKNKDHQNKTNKRDKIAARQIKNSKPIKNRRQKTLSDDIGRQHPNRSHCFFQKP